MQQRMTKGTKKEEGSDILAYMRERVDEEMSLRANAEEAKQLQMD